MFSQLKCLRGHGAHVGYDTFDLKPGFQHGTDLIVNEVFNTENAHLAWLVPSWAALVGSSATCGRWARRGQSVLLQRQYHDTNDDLTAELVQDLIFH